MKNKVIITLLCLIVSCISFSSCKKCSNCNYNNTSGAKGPTFEVCGDDLESLKAQNDADKYTCVEA